MELARTLGVSRITVQQALELLEKEGRVSREQGRGTFYVGEPSVHEPARLSGLLESVVKYREGAFVRMVAKTVVPATPRMAERLQIAVGTPVVRVERVAGEHGMPIMFVVACLPYEVGSRILDDTEELGQTKAIVSILQDKHGVHIVSVLQTIAATLADPELSRLIGVELGAPLLEVERTYFGDDQRPVNFSTAFYRTDKFRFQVSLKEWR